MLASNPTAPAPAQSAAPKWHDVTITTKRTYKCAKVEGVPPEEFGISRNAKNIRDSSYCFHDTTKSQSDLIDQGYDAEQVRDLPSYPGMLTIEQISRDTIDEHQSAGRDALNQASRMIRVTEHYIKMDYEGEGKTALYRVTTGGEESEVLTKDGEEDIVKIDFAPFAAMTPIIVTHRFFGKSIADLVMDIQRIKTALVRGALDNLYLHNNPRVEVSESHRGDNTLDDLLVSRPGGVVRTKQPGGLNWQVVPDITASIYPALQYMDATREWRTGVSRQGQGTDPNQLQNQVATIANQMFNAAQAKTKLIARIFAETGIKDLFMLLHGIVRKNGSEPQTVRLRNEWVPVDPRDWKQRNDMTINVGLGTGSKAEQLSHLQLIIGAQTQAVQVGLVSKKNLWESAKELTKLAGHKDHARFFTPPGQQQSPGQPPDPDAQPIPPPPDPKQAEIQAKAEAEKAKIQGDMAHQQMKTQADIAMQQQKLQTESQLAQQKFDLERELKLLDAQMKREAHQLDLQTKTVSHQQSMETAKTKQQPAVNVTLPHNEEIVQGINDLAGNLGEHLKGLGGVVEKLHQRMTDMEAHAAAPVEMIHDPKTKKIVKMRKGNREIAIKRA